MHLEMSEFNINSLVDEAISDMEMMTHYHHVNVVATNLDKEIEVYSDYDLILRVLTNLLSNAIKHSGEEMEGKGEVKLTVKDEGKCLRFEILDSGNWNSESFIPTDTLRMRLYASPPYIFILILERYGTTFVKN